MARVSVDGSPRMPRQRRTRQAQPARAPPPPPPPAPPPTPPPPATPAISAPAVSIATAAQGPGVHGRAVESLGRRRGGHHASSANSGSSANPPARPARHSELGAKVSVMVPDVPAGTTHPCCHPLTANGVNRVPALGRATPPEVILSGTTSTPAAAALGPPP